MIGPVAAAVDRAASAVALARSRRSRRRSRAESLGPAAREEALRQLVALYDRPGLADSFFVRAGPPRFDVRRVRRLGAAGEVRDLEWPSEYAPFVPDVAGRYLARRENRVARARVFLHRDAPRPAVLLIHGYLGGRYAVEERAWPVRWLFERGLDVALPVLPFHGPRSDGSRPLFPSSDPRITNEGFRQAVMDLRALADYLRGRGSRAVGAMGMSLGGYTTALVATLEPLAFAVPFIPLASIADFAREGGRFVGTEAERTAQHELLDAVHRIVSPLTRPVRVPARGTARRGRTGRSHHACGARTQDRSPFRGRAPPLPGGPPAPDRSRRGLPRGGTQARPPRPARPSVAHRPEEEPCCRLLRRGRII